MTEQNTCFLAKEIRLRDYFTSTIPRDDAIPDRYKPIRRISQPIQRLTRSTTPIRLNDTNKSTFSFTDKSTEQVLQSTLRSTSRLPEGCNTNQSLIRTQESIFDMPKAGPT